MRNYRRRLCSHSLGSDNDNEGDDHDWKDNSNARDDGVGVQKLKQPSDGNEKDSLIAAVFNASVAVSAERRGDENGLFVSFEGGRAAMDAVSSSTKKGGDDEGDRQNGARIASGIGFHMLRAMGWTENTGLGQLGKGMVDPILPIAKAGNVGIGFNVSSEYDTQQEAIRHVQKAKREERDRKLKLKVILLTYTGFDEWI